MACGTVRLSQALTIVTVCVFGALPDFYYTPRYRYTRVGVRGARPGRFVHECVLGHRNRSSFGPNSTRPAQIWPYTCLPDPNHSEPARAGRTSVCNRAVECRFRPRSPGGPRASARERVPWPVLRMARSWLYTIHTTLQTHANDRVHAKRALQREGRAEKTRWILRFHCGSCFRCTYWEHEW